MIVSDKSFDFIGRFAGAIAATDWPDTAPGREALDAMMAEPDKAPVSAPDTERLEAVADSVDEARRRSNERRKVREMREAERRAERARSKPVRRFSLSHNLSTQPARNEPEMDF